MLFKIIVSIVLENVIVPLDIVGIGKISLDPIRIGIRTGASKVDSSFSRQTEIYIYIYMYIYIYIYIYILQIEIHELIR